VVVDTGQLPWEPSPSGTVWRKPLYRQGGEFGPVSGLVRYAAGGAFAEHTPFAETGCLVYVRVGGL
jgi:hypothetical protein